MGNRAGDGWWMNLESESRRVMKMIGGEDTTNNPAGTKITGDSKNGTGTDTTTL